MPSYIQVSQKNKLIDQGQALTKRLFIYINLKYKVNSVTFILIFFKEVCLTLLSSLALNFQAILLPQSPE